jgi:hypothetical protein
MKKVFLSLAIVAALTVVSCKQAEAEVEATTDSVATEVVEEVAPVADSTVTDSTATEAPAAEAPAAK